MLPRSLDYVHKDKWPEWSTGSEPFNLSCIDYQYMYIYIYTHTAYAVICGLYLVWRELGANMMDDAQFGSTIHMRWSLDASSHIPPPLPREPTQISSSVRHVVGTMAYPVTWMRNDTSRLQAIKRLYTQAAHGVLQEHNSSSYTNDSLFLCTTPKHFPPACLPSPA